MSNAHTPGPWIIYDREIRPAKERRKTEREGLVTTIVTADTDLDGYGDEMANLRLIAAAPDLLAALEAVINDDVGGMAKARAALAKANGG